MKHGRRRFFQGTLAAAAISARPGRSHAGNHVPPWMQAPGAPVIDGSYGVPSPHEKNVVRRISSRSPTALSSASYTPLQDLHGIVTPNGLVFERHHSGIPDIVPDQHELMIHGLVRQPTIFTMSDLMRFPSVSRLYFLECSGNGSAEWKAPADRTVQQTHGLLSCCEWTGVPLASVLDEVGVDPKGRWLLAQGADAAAMSRSIPMEKALDDALLVYAQNGESLRPEQGYPVRLFLPGFEGNASVKWLRQLKVGTTPFFTREETSKYTDLMPDGSARQFTFMMECKSVITAPSGGQHLKEKGARSIVGLAWSGRGRIVRVDVSVDAGRTWRAATLQEPILPKALTRFVLPWIWEGGPATLQSRAIDDTGYVQPSRDQLVAARGLHSNYHNNAIQSWGLLPSGEVRNVHA